MTLRLHHGALVSTFGVCLLTSSAAADADSNSRSAEIERRTPNIAQVPLSFEATPDEANPDVQYVAKGLGYNIFLARGGETVLALRRTSGEVSHAVRLRPVAANQSARAEGLNLLAARTNYLLGSDAAKWRTQVPSFGRVRYQSVYPGIDLVYYGHQRQLEYDFIVHPGADPTRIAVAAEGAERLELAADGDLILHVGRSQLRQRKPVAYQVVDGVRRSVLVAYEVAPGGAVRFRLGAYDPERELVIDPILVYATVLGGSGYEQATGIAVDKSGNVYVTGYTTPPGTFPTTVGAFDPTYNGGSFDVFVAKFDSTGSTLLYSTFVGGSSANQDAPEGIAVDASGNAYITGVTASSDFPTTPGAPDTTLSGIHDAFVLKLNPTGSALTYSTLFGGVGFDQGKAIAVDALGQAYVTGQTRSADFPVTAGAHDTTLEGRSIDSFVVKLNVDASAIVYASLLGSGNSACYVETTGIAVGGDGAAYVTGYGNICIPTTAGAFDPVGHDSPFGYYDAFVTKFTPNGAGLVYSTYLGGSNHDVADGIALDQAGQAYVVGRYTSSSDFPVTSGAFDTTFSGGIDVFVTTLSADGGSLVYSTFLGGSDGEEQGHGIAVDAQGQAHVTGFTMSTNFPTTPGALQSTPNANAPDVFVTKLSPAGDAIVESTLLGGSGTDIPYGGIALDPAGDAFVAGVTYSVDFPATAEAHDTTHNGESDVFVARLHFTPAVTDTAPPVVTCDAPDGNWHGIDVSLACTASDQGSGLAVPADAAFVLATLVPPATETTAAFTSSRTVCDLTGNCTTAGPIGGNSIDKNSPTITVLSPAAATTYLLNQTVPANYACSDGGSGVLACLAPVASGASLDTSTVGSRTFALSALDMVGNASTATVTYGVAYGVCLLYDPTRAHKSGGTIPLKMQLCDASGLNASDQSIVVTATGVQFLTSDAPGILEDSGSANPDFQFRYSPDLGSGGGYIFNLSLAGFERGTYQLTFTAGDDPQPHGLQFQVK